MIQNQGKYTLSVEKWLNLWRDCFGGTGGGGGGGGGGGVGVFRMGLALSS